MIRIGHAGVASETIQKVVLSPGFQKNYEHRLMHNKRLIIGKVDD